MRIPRLADIFQFPYTFAHEEGKIPVSDDTLAEYVASICDQYIAESLWIYPICCGSTNKANNSLSVISCQKKQNQGQNIITSIFLCENPRTNIVKLDEGYFIFLNSMKQSHILWFREKPLMAILKNSDKVQQYQPWQHHRGNETCYTHTHIHINVSSRQQSRIPK